MTPSQLLRKHLSDKETHHNYGPTYDRLFAPHKDSARVVLELGILNGCSLRAWRDYFTSAEIIGIDNDASRLVTGQQRIRSIHIDTTSRDKFMEVSKSLPELDIIIDDASHVPAEQVWAIAVLWPKLRSGGLYIVEDIYTPEHMELFRAFGAELLDLRRPGGCKDDLMAVINKS